MTCSGLTRFHRASGQTGHTDVIGSLTYIFYSSDELKSSDEVSFVMEQEMLKMFLDEMVDRYNHPAFIDSDPVQIPHRFTRDEDIEISAFLTATIAWGNRKAIIKSSSDLMRRMKNEPYHYITTAEPEDFNDFLDFKHRTFNGMDLLFYLNSLKNIYENLGGLRGIFAAIGKRKSGVKAGIMGAREKFFCIPSPRRTGKHFPDISKGASAKRINLFLKWMVRKDNRGVDFGIWDHLDPADLYIPLDVHTGNVARKLGLLKRKQNDWKAVEELTAVLREMDPEDPVKYDYALFGLGAFEGF